MIESLPGSLDNEISQHVLECRVDDRRVEEIALAAQAGSPGALAELHAIYSRRLYKTVMSITKHPQDAEDALQETFLRAHLAIHAFEGRSNIYTWLTRIAINSALAILRKRRARPEILFDRQPNAGVETQSFEIRDPAPNPEQNYDLCQRRVRLLRAIHDLDVQLRKPLQMQIAKGLRVKEISQELNLSEAAVKTRLHRARRYLWTQVRRWDARAGANSMATPRRNSQAFMAEQTQSLWAE
jgi:RNA polymerase sigma-70 factor, ECF subfamily